MTKREANQKVLDAVVDLTLVDHLDSADYLKFLAKVARDAGDLITQLAAHEINLLAAREIEAVHQKIDAATAADLNLTRDEADRAAERSEGCDREHRRSDPGEE